jgi:hypothetical protein
MSDVPLITQETLMKYIGGFPAYICNIIFMFGPNNTDDIYVQSTYIEIGKTRVSVSRESSSNKDEKGKGNGEKANSKTVEKEKLSCNY